MEINPVIDVKKKLYDKNISEMNAKSEGVKNGLTKKTVLKVGLEPTYPYGRHPLKMVCLPIPPLQRS